MYIDFLHEAPYTPRVYRFGADHAINNYTDVIIDDRLGWGPTDIYDYL